MPDYNAPTFVNGGPPALSASVLNAMAQALQTAHSRLTILENAGVGYTDERAQDAVADAFAVGTHSGISFAYDDAAGRISATVTAAGYSDEQAQDAIAAMIANGSHTGITWSYNDAANTLSATVNIPTSLPPSGGAGGSLSGSYPNPGLATGSVTNSTVATNAGISADKTADGTTNKVLTATERTKLAGVATGATANATDAQLRDRGTHTGTQTSLTISDFTEAVQDAVAALLGAGSNVILNYDDAANTLTLSATGAGGTGLDAEAVRDTIGVALVGAGNVSVVVNDAADTITITTTATVNSTDAALRDRSTHTGTQPVASITGLAAVATSGAKSDVGLGNVDNTSDLNKPVSAAQAAADAVKMGRLVPTTDIKTAAGGTYTAADRDLVRVDPTNGGFPIQLPPATDGRVIAVKDERSTAAPASTNDVPVLAPDGSTLVRIRMPQQARIFIANGATWTGIAGQDAIPAMDQRYTLDQAAAEPITTALRAQGRNAHVRRAPVTATPTVTATATLPSGVTRNHPAMNNRVADRAAVNPEFTYGNPNGLGKFGPSGEPFISTAKARYTPTANTTYGSITLDFWSDSPLWSVYEYANDAGTTRIICEGVEIAAWGAAIKTGTAQAGAASTITLDTGASAVNGQYNTKWIKITGGAGVGQHRQIAGYVGSTKVATVATAWTTVPDTTSTFAVTHQRLDIVTATSAQYNSIDWAGERRWRLYRVEVSNGLWPGIYTTPVDSVVPAAPTTGPRAVGITDSGWYSVGGTGGVIDSAFGALCKQLGWTPLSDGCIAGTGYLNDAPTGGVGTAFTARDRMLPPYNSWALTCGGSGNFTISWNGTTTASIATTADRATIQTAVDNAFGSGVFKVFASGALSLVFPTVYLLGRGSAAASTSPVTVDWSGTTGGWKLCERWSGVVAPYVPRDPSGYSLPFHIVYAIGTNDLPSINAAYTAAAVLAEAKALYADVAAAFPTARQWSIGPYNIAAWPTYATATPRSGEYLDLGLALRQAATETLPKIRGAVPYVEPYAWKTSAATTLSAAVSVGATTITTPVALAVDQNIIIESGSNGEARTVTAVSGSGPYTLTVAALTNAHAAGVTITPYGAWFTGNGTVAAPDGTGSADICRDPDRLHPTPFGALTLGVRAALEIDAIQTGIARLAA